MTGGLRTIARALAAAAALAVAPAAQAGPAVAVDVETSAVLHAHEPDRPWFPASLTKLMSVYVTLDAVEAGRLSLADPVVLSARAARARGNVTGWPEGTAVTVGEAIGLLVVKSANDTAAALAETVAGDEAAFVAEMNRTAAGLGMSGTVFANPHGIHDTAHRTTARDMAVLARALLTRFAAYSGVFARKEIVVRGERMTSFNRLLDTLSGADGMKTGYVCAAGYNIVGSATRDGRRVVAVVLGARSEEERARVAADLLENAFAGPQPSLLDAAPPAAAGARPIDMRPYVCEGRPMPADLADFGLGADGRTVPVPRPRPR